jgi:ACS family D-galactonate transporter-like MFS transporter
MPRAPNESVNSRTFAPALALLTVSVLINYVDRGNLSIAAPLLKEELHLSASQLGFLFSAFFWTYTVCIFVSGWLADRFNVNWVLAAGFTAWSLATAATGLVHGFVMLFLMRLLLGIGESVAFPSFSKILARHLPERDRGFANGFISAGMKCGPAVGTFGAGLLIAQYGWRPVFIAIGIASLVWLPAWWKWMPGVSAPAPVIAEQSTGPRVSDIFSRRSFWGATLGHFCSNYLFYFLITWLPFYLVHERQLSMQSMAKTAGVYYLCDAVSALATGWLTDFWIRRGNSVTLVRKLAMVVGHITAAVALVGCALAGPHIYLGWLMLVGFGCGMSGAGIFAFAQTLAGPRAAGRWVGLQNGIANVAGLVGPALTGFLVDWTGHFTAPLMITAVISVVGALGWALLVGQLEQTAWSPEPPLRDVLLAAAEHPSA